MTVLRQDTEHDPQSDLGIAALRDIVIAINGLVGTLTTTLAVLTTQGDLLTRGVSGNERLAIGSSTEVLRSDGTSVYWGPIPATLAYVLVAANYQITVDDCVIDCVGSFTVTLPDATLTAGQYFIIKNRGGGPITIARTLGQSIDGVAADDSVAAGNSETCFSTGSEWIVI